MRSAIRLLAVVLSVCLCLAALAGCAALLPQTGKLRIVASSFPPYDFARAAAGDLAEVTMLLPPAAESHSFEPTPQDILRIRHCDVFIYVGGESDEWVRGILDSMDTAHMQIVTLMDCVEAVEEESVAGMEAEQEEDNESLALPEYDEHVWTAPRNAAMITQKIAAALCLADAENAATYQSNAAAYTVQLDALDAKLRKITAQGQRKTIVFGDRFPFRYFAESYGLSYYAAFRGCSTETEASPYTVGFLIEIIKKENIPVVFCIELSDQRMAEMIADNTGAKVLRLHSCHNLSKADFAAGKTYLDFMEENAAALQEALG
ncbi:MAG: metal ABC transporter substrate-binding protein [Oscillospiraceae bacterium]|jgi:zinc transport system substrate-binding protein|nr:metal ABC transporter substrate-binding protein [Oscillospiraceae bacterium]